MRSFSRLFLPNLQGMSKFAFYLCLEAWGTGVCGLELEDEFVEESAFEHFLLGAFRSYGVACVFREYVEKLQCLKFPFTCLDSAIKIVVL